jgi:RNA-binding protein YhbY
MKLGKQGITDNFISNLQLNFKNNKNVKIKVLPSARSSDSKGKQDVKKYSDEIIDRLGKNYTSRIIGFTINLKKFRKPVR